MSPPEQPSSPPAPGQARQAGAQQAEQAPADPVRQRILRAAAGAFGTHGYAATSVEMILEAAGVSRRTFYKRFRCKEDVLRSLFERSVRMLLRTVTRAAERQGAGLDDPSGTTRAAVEAYVDAMAEAGPLSRVLLQEQLAADSPLAQQRDEAQLAFAGLLAEGAVLRGAPRPDPLLLSGVVAAINQICFEMAARHPGGDWDTQRARAAILRVISVLDS